MTLTEIRNAVIKRMTVQTAIAKKDVTYPNDPTFDPTGKTIWARLTNIPGLAGANEIGAGPVVHRTGIVMVQLFHDHYSSLRPPTKFASCSSFRMTGSSAISPYRHMKPEKLTAGISGMYQFHIALCSAM